MKPNSARRFEMRCKWLAVLTVPMLLASAAYGQLQTPNVQTPSQVDAVAITVTPVGPYPAAFTHTASPFVLFVFNRSGQLDDTYSLSLKLPQTGQSVTIPSLLDLHSTHLLQRDQALIYPLPGVYELRSQAHPDQVIEITITAAN